MQRLDCKVKLTDGGEEHDDEAGEHGDAVTDPEKTETNGK